MSNYKTWQVADIVDEYVRARGLQEPEKAILEHLKDRLPRMSMLDIGVGCGRTTLHFAPRVKGYIGLDYSAAMIAACKKRFSAGHAGNVSFTIGDARAMNQFPADAFDFVLFSFNGIDYIPARDRGQVFREVYRVGRDGGLFFFSTRNLQCVQPAVGERCFRSQAVINDGVHEGRLRTHYVRPAAQVARLRRHFAEIAVYSLAIGSLLLLFAGIFWICSLSARIDWVERRYWS